MEKIFKCLIIFMLVTSCAKPKVIETQMPGDKKLGCEELELAIFEAKKFRDDAKSVKNGTGGNVTRLVFFWPAWAKSMHNADKAQIAADDRIYHLTVLKRKKNCITSSISSLTNIDEVTTISKELKELRKLYNSGVINDIEYQKAKTKVLK
tara:strand:+ start:85 stop:537 length:453 start_codon:yes stop_codon:yes gene_type:complete